MREGITPAQPGANFPRKTLKENRKNRIRLETFKGDKNWENENSRLFEHKAPSSMSIMLIYHTVLHF